jgi:RNA polymerase sigma-70 factor (ECF subfamily)
MQPPITPTDIDLLLCEADVAAQRLHRRCQDADLDDLRQDLLLDLIRRLPRYDPRRGNLGAFAGVILRNQASRMARQIHHRRRSQGGALVSLDAPCASGTELLGATLAEADGLGAWQGQHRTPVEEVSLRHDLACALGALPADARDLCVALATRSVSSMAGDDGLSRSSLYRRLTGLRLDFSMLGLGPGWDASTTA